jgi:single-strand DNA-binding protein
MLNKVLLIGNLTRDPESKDIKENILCKFSLAINKTSDRENTVFIDVDAWNKTGKACADFLKKGSRVLVEGKLKFENWTSAEGQRRNKISVTASSVKFLNRPEEESNRSKTEAKPENAAEPQSEISEEDQQILSDIPF